jgi:uncharacterized protein (DUF305 family)
MYAGSALRNAAKWRDHVIYEPPFFITYFKNIIMKKTIAIAVSFILSIVVFQSCGNNNTSETNTKTDSSHNQPMDTMTSNKMGPENNDLMTAMHSSMKEMKMTGDFDQDFASTMIQHHQEAVDMSQVELSKGNDSQVKGWAQNIITAQKAEIEHLQQVLKNYKTPGKKEAEEKTHQLKDAMDKMMNDMMSMKMTGNMDKDFLMMMIKHHETAITMAKDEISRGKNAELKKMAQKIISDQTKEIKDFHAWLDKNK